MYNISNRISADEIKSFRKSISMTQKEFADFLGMSVSSVERMEKKGKITIGPEAVLIHVLYSNQDWLKKQYIPPKKEPLRLWYMHRDKCCSIIDVNDFTQTITVTDFIQNIHFSAFGNNKTPSYEDYQNFLKSRCFPETRDKIKIQLEALGLPFYDPFLIIEKTQGRMAEDEFWIKIER